MNFGIWFLVTFELAGWEVWASDTKLQSVFLDSINQFWDWGKALKMEWKKDIKCSWSALEFNFLFSDSFRVIELDLKGDTGGPQTGWIQKT